ncbi:hypothetical protein K7432_014211 [Basidiobolus ranarum]|uniref:Midasin n=1 Tax=Basidiobolus ranarum TaxID=34480 RepID=A0ABR2WHY5_9FUNG
MRSSSSLLIASFILFTQVAAGCEDGEVKCSKGSIEMCDNAEWKVIQCATGTTCQSSKKGLVVCGFDNSSTGNNNSGYAMGDDLDEEEAEDEDENLSAAVKDTNEVNASKNGQNNGDGDEDDNEEADEDEENVASYPKGNKDEENVTAYPKEKIDDKENKLDDTEETEDDDPEEDEDNSIYSAKGISEENSAEAKYDKSEDNNADDKYQESAGKNSEDNESDTNIPPSQDQGTSDDNSSPAPKPEDKGAIEGAYSAGNNENASTDQASNTDYIHPNGEENSAERKPDEEYTKDNLESSSATIDGESSNNTVEVYNGNDNPSATEES